MNFKSDRLSPNIKCKLTTRNHYYNAHVQFSSADPVAQFTDTWAIICLEIASHVNAKAINIPLSYNSYKPKPYAYLNFSSFESFEAAKELTIAFRNKGLTWHSPDEAKNLCHICGRHGYSPSRCSPRPTCKTNDRLNKLYTQFNAGPKRGYPDFWQSQSSSRSQELKIQLNDIAQQLKKVSWMEYFITDHEYCIRKLKSMLNYDGPPDNTSRLLSKQCWLGQLSSKH
ncbi:hypothetical protein RhiirA1_473204 [Rhizophagus irregularis]|uniref:Uncharacterized protein n=1 Tax=Rhizophagus irregularis TaxID=588596 RepID=A0A2N0R103_9GLOM|nr:hypothetical protein RhiirA1_473204 [Rhizophagus irregularis]